MNTHTMKAHLPVVQQSLKRKWSITIMIMLSSIKLISIFSRLLLSQHSKLKISISSPIMVGKYLVKLALGISSRLADTARKKTQFFCLTLRASSIRRIGSTWNFSTRPFAPKTQTLGPTEAISSAHGNQVRINGKQFNLPLRDSQLFRNAI